MLTQIFSILISLVLVSCASTPPPPAVPEWTHQASRMVDNGYLVYVAKAESSRADDAQFKAEGLALEDLSNECSLIPKGTRIEDRYLETTKTGYASYVKAAVEFTACDESMKANNPEAIRKIANAAFTGQLKKYQDMQETGFRTAESGDTVIAPDVIEAPPAQSNTSDHIHFYVVRQYIAYQKEVVVLSPATSYAPGSTESVAFNKHLTTASNQVSGLIQKDPSLRSSPTAFHELPAHVALVRPAALTKAINRPRGESVSAPAPPRGSRAEHSEANRLNRQKRKVRRRRW